MKNAPPIPRLEKKSIFKKIHAYHFPLFYILSLLFIRFCLIFSYSVDLDGTEFAFIHNSQLLYKGISIYRSPDAFPFYAVMYTPLYYYFLLLLSKIFALNPIYEVHRLMIIARSVNLGLMFINLWMFYTILSRFKLSKNYIFSLLLFFMLLMTGHFFVARPDGIKITLFIAQLYCLLHYFYFDVKKKRFLVLMVFFNLLAFLVKQDSIVYSNFILFLLFLIRRDKTSFLLLIASLAGIVLSYTACLFLFSKSFFTNTFIYNFQSITDFRNSYNLYVIGLSLTRLSPLLVLCMGGFIYFRKSITIRSAEFLLGTAAGFLLLVCHVFMLKSGAYINYSFEFIVVLILLSGKILSLLTPRFSIGKYSIFLFAGYFILLEHTNRMLNNYILRDNLVKKEKTAYDQHFATAMKIRNIIGDDVFFLPNASNLVYFGSFKNIFYGYDAHIDRFINLYLDLKVKSALLLASPEKTDESFTNGCVQYIVIENDRRSEAHIHRYYPNYFPFQQVDNFILYKFRSN